MTKYIFIILLMIQMDHAFGNDMIRIDVEDKASLSVDKIRNQMEVKGDIYVLDKNGNRVLNKSDGGHNWRFGSSKSMEGNWVVNIKNMPIIALQHIWDFTPDGKLIVKIKQYDSISQGKGDEIIYGKLLKEKDFTVENFSSVTWVLFQDSNKRVIAKFEPYLWVTEEHSDVGKLPINSGRMLIYDNKGNLWASRIDNSDGKNVYFGVTTHKGTIYLSYSPFRGAKEIGFAEKGRIKIEDKGQKIFIESSEPLLPRGISAKVYGMIDLDRKTDGVNTVRSFGNDEEKGFLLKIE